MTVKHLNFRSGKTRKNDKHFNSSSHQLSHDLRTPLHHIIGFAELLLMDKGLSPANAEYVRAILSGGETLKATVISYLDRTAEIIPDFTVLPKTHRAASTRASDLWSHWFFKMTAKFPLVSPVGTS